MNMHDAVTAIAAVGTLRRGWVRVSRSGKLPSLAWVNSIRDAVYRAPSTEDTEALMMIQLNTVAMTGMLRLLSASASGLDLVPALARGDIAGRIDMNSTPTRLITISKAMMIAATIQIGAKL